MIQRAEVGNLMAPRAIALFGVAAAALVGCDNQPAILAGTWRGANAEFTDVTLVLQQSSDSLAGTISLTFITSPTPVTIRVSGHVDGDSLEVSGPLQPSSGYSSLGFAGHVLLSITPSARSTLIGHVLISGGPEATVISLLRV